MTNALPTEHPMRTRSRDDRQAGAPQGGPRHPRRPDIQGLRAAAVLAVVVNHANPAWLPGGYVGVDIFFVISGFLITGQLVSNIEASGSIQALKFFAARIRRLLPMSVLVLVASLAAAKVLWPRLILPAVTNDGIAAATYVSNIWFALQETDYLANQEPSLFQHYWSLALEEQFYLLWPLLLLIAYKLLRTPRALMVAIALVTAASFVACILLTDLNQPWAFFSLPTRAWEFGVGALVAVCAPRINGRGAKFLAAFGMGLVVVSLLGFDRFTPFPGTAALLPVTGTAVVIAAATSNRILDLPAMQWVGDRSYSLYLWHWPLLLIPTVRWGELSTPATFALMGAALALSWASHRWVEETLRHAPLLNPPPRSYAMGAALTALSITAALAVSATSPLHSGRSAPAVTAADILEGFAAPSHVPNNLTPSFTSAADDVAAVYNDGCHAEFHTTAAAPCRYGRDARPKVAVFGDSHAAHWIPGIEAAVAGTGQVITLTKSSCPSVDQTVHTDVLGRVYRECDEWRDSVFQFLHEEKPDIIVLSNFGTYYRNDLKITAGDWKAAVGRTLSSLPAESRVVILGDTPRWPMSMNTCLSTQLHSPEACGRAMETVTDSVVIEAERDAARRPGSTYVDTRSWLCADLCHGIGGNLLMYRDDHHITASLSTALAPRLRAALLESP